MPKKKPNSFPKIEEVSIQELQESRELAPLDPIQVLDDLDIYFTISYRRQVKTIFLYLTANQDLCTPELKDQLPKLLTTYFTNVDRYEQDSGSFFLEDLAEKSGVNRGALRRLLDYLFDYMTEGKVRKQIQLFRPALVEKAIQLALDTNHELSGDMMKYLLQHIGIAPVPKGQEFTVNINHSSTINNNNQSFGLPSFAETIRNSEIIDIEDESQKQLPPALPVLFDLDKTEHEMRYSHITRASEDDSKEDIDEED